MKPRGRRRWVMAAALALGLAMPALPAGAEWSMTIREIRLDHSLWRWRGGIMPALTIREGEPYRADEVARTVRLLESTGSFRSVAPVISFDPDGVRIAFELVPQELVSSVSFSGNFLTLEKDLRPVVRTVPPEVFDRVKADQDTQRLRELYIRRGFFDTEVTLESKPDEQGWGTAVVFRIKEGKPGVVQDVQITGNQRFSATDLAFVHRVISYTFCDPDEVDEAAGRILEHYRQEGYLDAKVKGEITRDKGMGVPSLSLIQPLKSIRSVITGQCVGVSVIFRIEEGQPFNVAITGQREMSVGTLRDLITFYQTGFFDQFEAEESRDAILRHYRNNGYARADVQINLDKEKRTASFVIREGPEVRIRSIAFTGNATVSAKDLLGLMSSAPGIFGPRLYRADVMVEDLKKIEAFYFSRGYTRVEVKHRVELPPAAPEWADIVIDVAEGPRAALGTVVFLGATVLGEPELREAVGLPERTMFQPDWVAEAKKNILDRYARLGYADCEVSAELDFQEEGRRVNVTFHLHEGIRRRLGKIVVTGNRRTRPQVVAREFDLREGEYFDPIKLYRGRQNLFELGFFSRVDLVLIPAPPDQIDLVVKVREKDTGHVSVGVGYDSEEQLRSYIEVGENNLWGTGRALRLKYKLSMIGYRVDTYFKEPWILGFHQDLNFNLYYEKRQEPGYSLRKVGGRLFSDRSLSRHTSLYTAYRYEKLNYNSLDPALLVANGLDREYRIGSLEGRLTYDVRDNIVNPHRGYMVSGDVEVALPVLGSQVSFAKYQASGSEVVPLLPGAELVFAARLGLANRLDQGRTIPLSERFFAGGANTVRGYPEKGLGPKDLSDDPLGGKFLVLGNVECRFRIWGSLGAVLFLDAGNVWRNAKNFDAGEIRKSVGGGLHYETPVGPVRLEYGYKLDPLPGEALYCIHFTLGYPF